MSELPVEAYKFYQKNPVDFIQDQIMCLSKEEIEAYLPGKRVEPEQKQIINAIVDNKRVAVRTGHGIGKTSTLAWLILWWLYIMPAGAKCLVTGSKFDQLKITTWAELNKWLNKSFLTDKLIWHSESMFHADDKSQTFARIMTSSDQENITGFHDEHILILVDEASAESIDKIQDGLMGCATKPHNRILFCGNPTRTRGAFFECFNKNKNLWYTLHFNSENSINVDPEWLQFMRDKYDEKSDIYAARVLGNFPKGNPKSIISLTECEEAAMRDVPMGDIIELGIDPAWEGDDLATIGVRCGYKYLETRTYPKCSPNELYHYTLKTVKYWKRKTGIQSRIRIKIDVGGGYGASLVESISLNETENIEAVPVYFNGKTTNPEYKNYGTEMWFHLADIIDQIELPDDRFLIEELSGREWVSADLSSINLEPKSRYKERYGNSPDRADACVLCFAPGLKKVFQKSETNTKHFDIDWQRTNIHNLSFDGLHTYEIAHYISFVLDKNLSLYGLAAIYQMYVNKLWIYHEYYQETPVPDIVCAEIKKNSLYGLFDDERKPKIIGNDDMFRKQGDRRPVSEIFYKEGIPILQSYTYDEYGAVALGTQLFRDGNVILHSNLKNSRRDIETWSVSNKFESQGYCKALLITLSEIRKKIKEEKKPIYKYVSPYSGKPNDYHPIRTNIDKKNNFNAWLKK